MNLFDLLFIVMFTLKLCGIITFSWWLVTAPLWGSFVFGFVIVFIVAIIRALTKH